MQGGDDWGRCAISVDELWNTALSCGKVAYSWVTVPCPCDDESCAERSFWVCDEHLS